MEPISLSELAWRVEAACLHHPPEWWFPADEVVPGVEEKHSDGNHAMHAKAICANCPVAVPCGTWAVINGEKFGIWGGIGGSKLKWLRRLWEDYSDPTDIENRVQAEVSALRGNDRPWVPASTCRRCGKAIPAGRWPPDRNSSGTSCGSAVAYAKGARCWTARMSNAMRQMK